MMDKELIRQIVREVLAEMTAGTGSSAPVHRKSDHPRRGRRPVITEVEIRQLAESGREVELPKDAILTPLAKDFIFEKKLSVRWVESKGT